MRLTRLLGMALIATMALACSTGALLAETQQTMEPNSAIVNLELKDVPVRDAIDALFQGKGLRYIVQPGVVGRVVELKITGVTFDQALNALTSAAGLTYTLEEGTYIIKPVESTTSTGKQQAAQASTGAGKTAGQAPLVEEGQPAPPQDSQAPQGGTANQLVINQPSPVYYGSPAVPAAPYPGYGYQPVYQYGNVGIIPSGYGSVLVIGGGPYVKGYGLGMPPPPGWVSPDNLRFLRGIYAISPRPLFYLPY